MVESDGETFYGLRVAWAIIGCRRIGQGALVPPNHPSWRKYQMTEVRKQRIELMQRFARIADEVSEHYGVEYERKRVVEALVALTGHQVGTKSSPTNVARSNPRFEIAEGSARNTMERMIPIAGSDGRIDPQWSPAR